MADVLCLVRRGIKHGLISSTSAKEEYAGNRTQQMEKGACVLAAPNESAFYISSHGSVRRNIFWLLGLDRIWRWSYLHVVVSPRGSSFRDLTTHASNVGDQLPHLIFVETKTIRWHAFRTTLDYRGKDLLRLIAINPFIIAEGRSDVAAAMSVATDAIEVFIKALPFA